MILATISIHTIGTLLIRAMERLENYINYLHKVLRHTTKVTIGINEIQLVAVVNIRCLVVKWVLRNVHHQQNGFAMKFDRVVHISVKLWLKSLSMVLWYQEQSETSMVSVEIQIYLKKI